MKNLSIKDKAHWDIIALNIASQMVTAAKTAPKAKGRDTIRVAIAANDEISEIANTMDELAKELEMPFLSRDAACIRKANALVLIGTTIAPLGMPNCGLCGLANCQVKDNFPKTPCAFNTIDLGIAIGSAVSIAADCRVDNRILYSVSFAVSKLQCLGTDVAISAGIPISITGKNPFFDRQ